MEQVKIYPSKRYSINRENEQYENVKEFILAILPLKDMIPKKIMTDIYDSLREGMNTENVLCLGLSKEEEIIYIFEYDLHKDATFKSEENENGIPYLILYN